MDRENISDTLQADHSVVVSVVGSSSRPSRQQLRLLSDLCFNGAEGQELAFLDLKPCHLRRVRLLEYTL